MKIDLSYELICFVSSIASGLLIGLLYDLSKTIRHIFGFKNICDICFWCLAIFLVAKIWYEYQNGELRAFMLTGALLGAVLYFFVLEKYIFSVLLFIIEKICRFFKLIFKILLTPLKFLCKIFNIYVTKARTKFQVKVKDENYEKKACFKS